MFASGDAEPTPRLARILDVISEVLQTVKNGVIISGHTDAQVLKRGTYSNWELSSDRANSVRRDLENDGLAGNRVLRVEGRAATDPLLPLEPLDPRNRRIAITVLRSQVEMQMRQQVRHPSWAAAMTRSGITLWASTPALRRTLACHRKAGRRRSISSQQQDHTRMSINTAINSALSGMNAEATDLSTIASNVANSSTVGYKATNTDFESMVLGSGNNGAAAGGVQATTWTDVSSAGQIDSTGVSTDLAINGSGFFVVNTAANGSVGNYLLTQAGSFRPDANGNLVNAAGYYLQGQPIPATGVAGSVPQNMADLSTVNIANLTAAATPTTAMTYAVNLPSNDTAYSATPPAPSSSTAQYYDALGNQQTLTFDFTPTTAATANAAPTDTWTMNIYDFGVGDPDYSGRLSHFGLCRHWRHGRRVAVGHPNGGHL